MKTFFLTILATCLFISVSAQNWIWSGELSYNIIDEQKIQYIGGKLDNTSAYSFSAGYNIGGRAFGFCCQADYTKIDLKNINIQPAVKGSLYLLEASAGIRYYPIIPTIRIGTTIAIRFTAGFLIDVAAYGWKQNEDYSPDPVRKSSPGIVNPLVYGGFCFSPFRNTTGLSIRFVYRPKEFAMQNFPLKDFTLKEPYAVSISFFIGSRID